MFASIQERIERRQKYIPKADGRQQPLGIAAIEDKIVQVGGNNPDADL
jgi:hypothetical protein